MFYQRFLLFAIHTCFVKPSASTADIRGINELAKKMPDVRSDTSLRATSCAACGSTLNNQASSLSGKSSPSCPDEEIVLAIGVQYFPPGSKWLVTLASPLWITTNYLCFSGGTIKGDVHDMVIRLADITRIYEEEYRRNIFGRQPTLVIESGGDKFRFLVIGKGVSDNMYARDYGTRSRIRRRTNNPISFINTKIDLMSRTARPLTKDEIRQAYREKYPERLTTRFKAHLVIYVVVNLLLLGVELATAPGRYWGLYLIIPLIWGLFLFWHYVTRAPCLLHSEVRRSQSSAFIFSHDISIKLYDNGNQPPEIIMMAGDHGF